MLLLDTHALIWLASDQQHLTEQGKFAIHQAAGRLFLSAISTLEIALLVKRNRLELPQYPGLLNATPAGSDRPPGLSLPVGLFSP